MGLSGYAHAGLVESYRSAYTLNVKLQDEVTMFTV